MAVDAEDRDRQTDGRRKMEKNRNSERTLKHRRTQYDPNNRQKRDKYVE